MKRKQAALCDMEKHYLNDFKKIMRGYNGTVNEIPDLYEMTDIMNSYKKEVEVITSGTSPPLI